MSRLHSVSCTCSLAQAGQSKFKHFHWSTVFVYIPVSIFVTSHPLFAGAVTCASRRRRRREILSAVSADNFEKGEKQLQRDLPSAKTFSMDLTAVECFLSPSKTSPLAVVTSNWSLFCTYSKVHQNLNVLLASDMQIPRYYLVGH